MFFRYPLYQGTSRARCYSQELGTTNFFRHNIATDEWVVFALGRTKRPSQFPKLSKELQPVHDPHCPFCPGNEHQTGESLVEFDKARVVSNKYPVLQPCVGAYHISSLESQSTSATFPAVGYHEVVIEGDQHNACIADDGGSFSSLSHTSPPPPPLLLDPSLSRDKHLCPNLSSSLVKSFSFHLVSPWHKMFLFLSVTRYEAERSSR
eukprot:TRINITY_DN2698_c0_g1_i2.p1 TRINITY_DN2698_c0_g1~~TRINITY_DN2698_c0_g1_i2.p1  ORF type:complete len:207 (+),score=27.80 TRINITY_DN2698_c0_g1_i2:82-702(+)